MQHDLLAWSERVSVAREDTSRPSIEERWAAFHAENPHVFAEALRIAREWLERGDRYISVKAVYEAMRTNVATQGDAFRLNNDYTATIARLLIEAEPRLEAVIKLRRTKR